jgi:uncharacterized RDD family membrane protein YckC
MTVQLGELRVTDTTEVLLAVTPMGIARKMSLGGILVRRWLGAWIDFVVLASLFLAPDYFLGNAIYQKTLYVWVALAVLYFPITEGLFGRTLGKLIAGTVVVNSKGKPPGLLKAFIRTLTRLLEVNPILFGGMPAANFVRRTQFRQRLGDVWADTYVIPAKDLKRVGTSALRD